MKAELLDKEVLCLLDTRQIQKYIFRTNSFMDTLGASDLLLHILDDAILYALHNIDEPLTEEEYDIAVDPDHEIGYFTSEKVKFQLITNIAGNALCLVRTGALCQKIIRKISRYYLEQGYSLNLAAAVVEKTDNLSEDIAHVHRTVNAVKASGEISNPLGTLPVVIREKGTGNPAVCADEKSGELISSTSKILRSEAGKRASITDFAEIRTSKGGDGKKYRAVLHADGNNLGMTISSILHGKSDYREAIRTRRQINQCIYTSIWKVITDTLSELKNNYLLKYGSEEGFEKDFYVIHVGGDDINVMCNANMAFPFAEIFFKNLKNASVWETPEERVPLYACMGIAFVTPEYSFQKGFELANECCGNAKKIAKLEKNLRNGLAGNWIDFQFCDNPNSQDLDLLRNQLYVTGENINLYLRPYCMDDSCREEIFSYHSFMQRARNYRRLQLNDDMHQLMKRSYGIGKQFFTQCITAMEKSGIDLTGQLGAPLYSVKGEQKRAVWYDAVEVSDLIRERKEENHVH